MALSEPCAKLSAIRKAGVANIRESRQHGTSNLAESDSMAGKSLSSRQADTRARRRAQGMRAMEAVFFERELETLDAIKSRLNLNSRSEVLRLLLAKTDPNSLTPDDAVVLKQDAA
ncbi:hypothetical protein [Aureimonas altamirensis]|uniref:hypothetical protein n=1 Tax=Aureimonas altamirensis TaxID=370622 RepID=UPI002554C89E|nr:hypothetical protein [Aureimonas altamirensis]